MHNASWDASNIARYTTDTLAIHSDTLQFRSQRYVMVRCKNFISKLVSCTWCKLICLRYRPIHDRYMVIHCMQYMSRSYVMVRLEKFILNSKLCMMQADTARYTTDTLSIHRDTLQCRSRSFVMVRLEKFILNSKLCMMQADMSAIQPGTQPIHWRYIVIHCNAGVQVLW